MILPPWWAKVLATGAIGEIKDIHIDRYIIEFNTFDGLVRELYFKWEIELIRG